MYIRTKGIVLHTVKYSETSIIARIYTQRLGLQSYIIKGVRSAKSKSKASLYQPLSILEMEVTHRQNRQLQFIRECRRDYAYRSLPFDTVKSTIALFMLEVLAKSIREHEENTELFDFILGSLSRLDEAMKPGAEFHLLFMLQLSRHLGFMPHENYTESQPYFEMTEGVFTTSQERIHTLDRAQSKLFASLLQQQSTGVNESTNLSRSDRRQLLRLLLDYYRLHLENFSIRSHEILEEILE